MKFCLSKHQRLHQIIIEFDPIEIASSSYFILISHIEEVSTNMGTFLGQLASNQFDNFDWFANSVSSDYWMHYSSVIMNQNYQISGFQDVEEGPISGPEIVYKCPRTAKNA